MRPEHDPLLAEARHRASLLCIAAAALFLGAAVVSLLGPDGASLDVPVRLLGAWAAERRLRRLAAPLASVDDRRALVLAVVAAPGWLALATTLLVFDLARALGPG